jgi:uncharacterized protein
MKALKVFDRLPIPVDYAATMKYAVLAKSNGGKTYLTLKFEEQMCDAGMFFVTLDPVGKHWALRAGADGSATGGKPDVWVLGGMHGDVDLEPHSGALIADTVIEHPGRYVLDVSTFETDADQDRFALDFARRLFRRKAKDPGFPLLLLLEEAESFIPQQPKPNQAPMLGAFSRIARQGRNHGIGLWMVAQRSAALNKGVLSQADVLIAKEMSHPRDRAPVDDWVETNGTREQRDELMDSLASLSVEQAWVWSPSWLRCFKRTRVLPRTTFDSSASVVHGNQVKAVKLAPLDVDALGKHIAETAERAKADDPRELRKRIKDLQRERDALMAVGGTQPPFTEEQFALALDRIGGAIAEVSELRESLGAAVERYVQEAEACGEKALDAHRYLAEAGRIVESWGARPSDRALAWERMHRVSPVSARPVQAAAVPRGGATAAHAGSRPDRAAGNATPRRREAATASVPAAQTHDRNGEVPQLKKGAREILAEMARVHPLRLTRSQIGLATGKKITGGTFTTYWGTLKREGLIEEDGRDAGVTATGLALAGVDGGPPMSTDEIREMWRSKLKLGARNMLDVVVDAYPNAVAREELADRLAMAVRGGTFTTYLGTLKRNGLVLVEPEGVQAHPDLFVGA